MTKLITKLPEEPYEEAIRKFAREGAHIPGDDNANPWVPFGDAAAIKHFCFRCPDQFGRPTFSG